MSFVNKRKWNVLSAFQWQYVYTNNSTDTNTFNWY